jgi:hypothetical protein
MLRDGIHFDLDEDEYHADPALGSTDLKDISIDPVDWQFDRLSKADREESDALVFGRALHCRLLEGRERFRDKHCVVLDMPKDALATHQDMQRWLRKANRPTQGTRDELIWRIRQADPHAIITDVLEEQWRELNQGRQTLTREQLRRIETAVEWMQNDATLSAAMQDGAFAHGAPEVSIFHTYRGVRLKARFDYLLGHAIIDIKSFAPIFKIRPSTAITKAIVNFRYDLQCAAYVKAWHAARTLYDRGRVFGSKDQQELLKRVYANANPLWIWVFVKTTSAPQGYVRQLDFEQPVFRTAAQQVEDAINTYRSMRDQHGVDRVWPAQNKPTSLDTTDFGNFKFGE